VFCEAKHRDVVELMRCRASWQPWESLVEVAACGCRLGLVAGEAPYHGRVLP
jgi:hypothetical protein